MALYEKTGCASVLFGSLLHEMVGIRHFLSGARLHSSACITIHPLRIHLRRLAGFLRSNLWFSSSSPSKRPERVSAVRVMRRYGKY